MEGVVVDVVVPTEVAVESAQFGCGPCTHQYSGGTSPKRQSYRYRSHIMASTDDNVTKKKKTHRQKPAKSPKKKTSPRRKLHKKKKSSKRCL